MGIGQKLQKQIYERMKGEAQDRSGCFYIRFVLVIMHVS